MKNLFSILFLFIVFISMNSSLKAQEAQGNVFIVTNYERAFPEDGSAGELDSLTTLLANTIYGSDNEYVVSQKVLQHWWGHNNRDFIQVVEVKSWDDVIKANQRATELFKQKWSTEEERENFNKANGKYFTGKHSDEIYRQVVFGK
jgi:hypothetical protein